MGFEVSGKDMVTYVPILSTIGLTIYVVWQAMRPKVGLVNPNIQKNESKVVNCVDVEDIGESMAFCRCWRSKKFPLCDGSHGAHNKAQGDNVGPVVVSRKK